MRFSPQALFFSQSLLALDFQAPALLLVFLPLSLLLFQESTMLPVQQTGLSCKDELPSHKQLFQAFQVLCTRIDKHFAKINQSFAKSCLWILFNGPPGLALGFSQVVLDLSAEARLAERDPFHASRMPSPCEGI